MNRLNTFASWVGLLNLHNSQGTLLKLDRLYVCKNEYSSGSNKGNLQIPHSLVVQPPFLEIIILGTSTTNLWRNNKQNFLVKHIFLSWLDMSCVMFKYMLHFNTFSLKLQLYINRKKPSKAVGEIWKNVDHKHKAKLLCSLLLTLPNV